MENRRVRAKGWFITMPRCGLSPEDALACWNDKGQVEEYVIAQEAHEDGGRHLHAFLKYAKPIEWKSEKWDMGSYHGNYQVAKSWKRVKEYVMKGGSYISNIDITSALAKKGKHFERNQMMKTMKPKELVETGDFSMMSIGQIIKSQQLYHLHTKPVDHETERGVWYWGMPRTGKTTRARQDYGNDLYIKAQNKWWDGYEGQKHVLLDDHDSSFLGHYLKLWADKWGSTGETKGGTVALNHITLIVTSNYSIEQLYGPDVSESQKVRQEKDTLVQALKARFTETEFKRLGS